MNVSNIRSRVVHAFAITFKVLLTNTIRMWTRASKLSSWAHTCPWSRRLANVRLTLKDEDEALLPKTDGTVLKMLWVFIFREEVFHTRSCTTLSGTSWALRSFLP